MARQDFCVECRHCDLRIDFDSGSHYFCRAEEKPLGHAVLSRRACRLFELPAPASHWGP